MPDVTVEFDFGTEDSVVVVADVVRTWHCGA